MASTGEEIRDRIARYDATFEEIRRILATETCSLDLLDPERELRNELKVLWEAMERTREQIYKTTDVDRETELHEVLERLCADYASVTKRSREKNVLRETYLTQLRGENQKRLDLLRRIRRILQRLPQGDMACAEDCPQRDGDSGHFWPVAGQVRPTDPQTWTRRRHHGFVKREEEIPASSPVTDAYHLPFTWPDAVPGGGNSSGASTTLLGYMPNRMSNSRAITNPQVGQLYLGYWYPEGINYAVIVLPFGSFAPVGLPGSIASTKLLDLERLPCHTRNHDTGAYAWSYGFGKDGDERVLDREFPVIWISTLHFPARAKYSWLPARDLSRFCLEKTPRPYWDTIRDFVRERNNDGCSVLTTDLDHPPGNGAPLDVPAVRIKGALCAQLDAYFDNLPFLEDDDNEFEDPTYVKGDESRMTCAWKW
ncbi:hypothetical protein E4U55_003057 [Claviceps digitariae]|nr:hypothetical protein E4U55_003057 [Claviceps digitariae]